MNRYEFENLISDYLDGSIPFKMRKEFEDYLKKDPDAESLVNNIRITISNMNKIKKVKTSEDFNEKLLKRVKKEGLVSRSNNNTIFGFTPFYASILTCLSVAFFVVASQVYNISQNSSVNNVPNHYTNNSENNIPLQSKNANIDKNYLVDSNNDTLQDKQEKQKPKNSNKIKFVNY